MRLGGSREVEADFRLVSATNSDLEQALAEGRFREDLYYRLNVFRIDVPPLRDRRSDIKPLALYFLGTFMRAMGKSVREIAPEGLRLLEEYDWPGNIRELRNVIERAIVVCPGERIEVPHLLFQFPGQGEQRGPEPVLDEVAPNSESLSLAEIEKLHVTRVLRAQEGNVSGAARVLGIDRATLYSKIKKYGIER